MKHAINTSHWCEESCSVCLKQDTKPLMVNAFTYTSQKVWLSALASGLFSPEFSYLIDSSQENSQLQMIPWWEYDVNQKEKMKGGKIDSYLLQEKLFPSPHPQPPFFSFFQREWKRYNQTSWKRALRTHIFLHWMKNRETLSSNQKFWKRKGCPKCLGDISSPGMWEQNDSAAISDKAFSQAP